MADPTAKPLPATLKEWAAEVAGIERFLDAVEKDNLGNTDTWVSKMQSYYMARHDHLLDNCPAKRYAKPKTRRKGR